MQYPHLQAHVLATYIYWGFPWYAKYTTDINFATELGITLSSTNTQMDIYKQTMQCLTAYLHKLVRRDRLVCLQGSNQFHHFILLRFCTEECHHHKNNNIKMCILILQNPTPCPTTPTCTFTWEQNMYFERRYLKCSVLLQSTVKHAHILAINTKSH